ncbi:hypothetical protein OIV40_25335 [Burkholderia pseudomallei]|uniref:hypothetical protein n=1 Tax=Burkholderia pseudomallei TaxID=28450 RepID=UPI0009B2A18D|nr:hypothetical protein [Burkholderia pseudomallei]MCW0116357.1 hypothetical protein [Burkholderia pseudomallei]
MIRTTFRRTLLAGVVAFAMSASGYAQTPTNGLGQSWPNARDVSLNPAWHVYVFKLHGIKYVQIDDVNGKVLGAIGTANGQFIVLPIGEFAQYVTAQGPSRAYGSVSENADQAATVYQDRSVIVTASPMSNGVIQLNAVAAPCDDPIECASHGN